jgi:DNA-directed RNA polymerase subunit RPC12/RpoP/very-short-patch-repair endonuclease
MDTVSGNISLMKEWHWAKNNLLGFDPTKLKNHSNKKVWWKGACGHEWEMSIHDRTMGRSCPYCSRLWILPGDNDLATTHPLLSEEWDYDENGSLTPRDVTSISIKRVGWICSKCGNKWKTKIRYRTINGSGCAECAKIMRGKSRVKTCVKMRGSLAEIHPELLVDWDYAKNKISPNEITASSNKFACWICHVCGYEWFAKISNRNNGRGCPCCSNRIVVPGKNDLSTTHPELAKEWHPTKNKPLAPSNVSYGSGKKVWWMCPNGHEYQATILHRASKNGTNCPQCNSGRQTSFREQAFFYYLRQIFNDAVSRYKADWLGRFELDVFIPSQRLGIEYDGIAWHKEEKFNREKRKYRLCKEKGVRLIRIKERMPSNGERGQIADEILSVQDIEKGQNFDNLIRFVVDRLDPRSNMWTRKYLNDFHSPVDIDLHRDRFKILQTAIEIKESAAELYPHLVKEWHPTKNGIHKLSCFKPGSDFKSWWVCLTCGREYEATINHRVNGTGCRICGFKKLAITKRKNAAVRTGGVNDDLLIEEWNYDKNGDMSPSDFAPGSSKKVWWKCSKCNYEWRATIANRTQGKGCPCCANRVVVTGKNDLATLYPKLVQEWDYDRNGKLTPDIVLPGHNGKVWWKCLECGRSYQAPPSRRTSQGSGCRKCADKMNWTIRRANAARKECDKGQLFFDI